MNKEYYVKNLDETKKLALELSKELKGGEVIFAYGDLGTGKTAFFKALGKDLGVTKVINSPTFNLIKIYNGTSLTLYHVDCYRLEKADEERKDLELDEIMGDKSTITYIEWPMYANRYMREYKPRIEITFSYISEDERRIEFKYEK